MQGVAGFFRHIIKPPFVGNVETSKTNTDKVTETVGQSGSDKGDNFMSPHSSSNVTQETSMDGELVYLRETVYDLIKDIKDPEKPQTLEELDVVSEENVFVQHFNEDEFLVKIVFVPTVPHCSLASLIGLCMRQKLIINLPEKYKLDIYIKEGSHDTAEEINKQINDKERIAAAMENPNLRELVNNCIDEERQ